MTSYLEATQWIKNSTWPCESRILPGRFAASMTRSAKVNDWNFGGNTAHFIIRIALPCTRSSLVTTFPAGAGATPGRSRSPSNPDMSPADLYLSPKLKVRFELTDEIKQQKLKKLTNIPLSPIRNTEENGNVAGIIVIMQERSVSKETTFNQIQYVRSFNQIGNFLNRPRALNGAGLHGVPFIAVWPHRSVTVPTA